MFKFLSLILISIFFIICPAMGQKNSDISYTVISCNDGDTCKVKSSDNISIKIRFVGIDAPECAHKGKRDNKKKGQPFCEESKKLLNDLIKGKNVKLINFGADLFGRNLAEVYLDNENINQKMIAEGLAEVYKGSNDEGINLNIYLAKEHDAQKNKRGIWSIPNYQSPSEYRKK